MLFPYTAFAKECEFTTDDILGPFFAEDAPFRSVIASADEPGDRFFFGGKVFSDDCVTPLENTTVDIWHASNNGCYSIFETCTSGNPNNDDYNLRGRVNTDSDGNYAFETIRPGFYGNRPQHFHLRMIAEDGSELVTQVYFEGDPNIASDNWASDPDAVNRIIPLSEDSNGFSGNFDIVLDAQPILNTDSPWEPIPERFTLYSAFPNPFNTYTEIRFDMGTETHASVEVFDLSGKPIQSLSEGFLNSGDHQVVWNGKDNAGNSVPSGMYVILFDTAHFSDFQKVVLIK